MRGPAALEKWGAEMRTKISVQNLAVVGEEPTNNPKSEKQ